MTSLEASSRTAAWARRSFRVLTVAGAMAAGAVVAAVAGLVGVDSVGSASFVSWWLVALLFAGADVIVLRFPVFGRPHAVSVTEIPLIVGLAFLSPIVLVGARIAGAVAPILFDRDRDPAKTLFNIALSAFEIVLAVGVYRFLLSSGAPTSGAGLVAAGAAAVIAAVAASMLVTLAVSSGVRLVPTGIGRVLLTGYAWNVAVAGVGIAVVALTGLAEGAGVAALVTLVVGVSSFELGRRRS